MMFKVSDLLADEIENGFVNKNKLEEKIAAFLEFVNLEMKAFDVKNGHEHRIMFEDSLVVSMKKGKETKKIKIVSPRLTKGEYVCSGILISECEARGFFNA